jgi:hypothetical protein
MVNHPVKPEKPVKNAKATVFKKDDRLFDFMRQFEKPMIISSILRVSLTTR